MSVQTTCGLHNWLSSGANSWYSEMHSSSECNPLIRSLLSFPSAFRINVGVVVFFFSSLESQKVFQWHKKSLSKHNSKPYFRIYTFLCCFFIATVDANGSTQINKYTERVNLQIYRTAIFAPLLWVCVCRAAFHPTFYSPDRTGRVVESAAPYTVLYARMRSQSRGSKIILSGSWVYSYTSERLG